MVDVRTRPMRSEARTRRQRWVSAALVLGVLLGGAGGSWAITALVQRLQQRHAEELMDQHADNISRAVAGEVARYSETLLDLAAGVGSQSDFSAADFAGITSQLSRQRLSGVSGVVFAVSAADSEVAAVQARWRDKGAAGLRLVPVGVGREHMFVVFTHTLDGTMVVPGRDLSQAAEPLEALRLARSSEKVAASRTYVLLKDRNLPEAERQLSYSLATAVYGGIGQSDAGRFRGWILVGMRGGDFINETIRAEAGGGVTVTLNDLSDVEPRTVASTRNLAHAQAAPLQRVPIVTVGQRDWQLRIQSTDTLLNTTDRRLPGLAGGIGLLLTILIAILANGRQRALRKVDQATAALRLDIEQRKTIEARLRQSEHELRHQALHDPLTGLANRTLFYERLEHAMATHGRTEGTLAVFFIDLDGFKKVNDDYGHIAGDALLTEVADRLRECARDSDTVARFGGDEFAILTEQLVEPEHGEIIADRVVRALHRGFEISGQPVAISCSVGVAVHCQNDLLADDLLRNADEAMYAAKTSGKDRYALAVSG